MSGLVKKQGAFYLLGLAILVALFSIYSALRKQDFFYNHYDRSTRTMMISFLDLQEKINQHGLNREISLMFVGDIMLNRSVEIAVKKYGDGNFIYPFLKISNYLQGADLLFGNLESVISDKGINVGSIYSFRADPEAIDGLLFAGFDVVSVANNHIFDYSREAMEDSFLRLKEAGIAYVGGGFSEEEAHSPVIKKINNTTIAYLAYCHIGSTYWQAKDLRSGIAWLNDHLAEDVKKARPEADIVVVSMHFGWEYNALPNETQEYFAHMAIDSGADLVIGHHPHVVQPVERYKEGYIAYSLGNFVFDQYFSEETMSGLLLEVLIDQGSIKEVKEKQIKINNFYQPEILPETQF